MGGKSACGYKLQISMRQFQNFLFFGLSVVSISAFAGLFSDDEARQQIQQLETRVATAEAAVVKLEALDAAYKKQSRLMLDLQTSVDAQNTEIRKLRGQLEELTHALQDAEKRQKDFYVDLDSRLRRFEAVDTATAEKANGGKNKNDELATENRALEAAYGFYKAGRFQNAVNAFQDFLNNYPQSLHQANVRYWMGNAYFVLKDYRASLDSYQILIGKFDGYPKNAEVMLSIADCQEMLNDVQAAKATLKLVTEKFPNSDAANKAKKHLATFKTS